MFIAGGVVVVAIAAILFFSRSKEAPASEPVVAVQMVKAERKSIRQIVTTEAILFPRRQSAVTPKVTAPVRKFYVNRGSRVHAGELLAVLEIAIWLRLLPTPKVPTSRHKPVTRQPPVRTFPRI